MSSRKPGGGGGAGLGKHSFLFGSLGVLGKLGKVCGLCGVWRYPAVMLAVQPVEPSVERIGFVWVGDDGL